MTVENGRILEYTPFIHIHSALLTFKVNTFLDTMNDYINFSIIALLYLTSEIALC
jgi:hypothetical protein